MSAAAYLLHNTFAQIVAQYHPFAEYEGFIDREDGFVLQYNGGNGEQYMLLDRECNVIGDSTLGTTRSAGLLALGASLVAGFMGVDLNS